MLDTGIAMKVATSGFLLWLLLTSCGLVLHVLGVGVGLGADECWVLSRDYYYYCMRTAKCRRACMEHHYVNGRCWWAFPYLLPLCECLRPKCAPTRALDP
ncbi:uncharacterized protein LOC123398973 [Hordeum vulgare subsp. vulgare]|uniref:Uncharacterized protein n=1 Tax=Hordeum vulgare subsp. vulgare TaxID=112509 RepID=A0A8I6XUY3_HORVV|nr:uncharacterized protein LOC123398973 [Hordeum vulgare subsp. vulgare]